jgi:hypothetical protein
MVRWLPLKSLTGSKQLKEFWQLWAGVWSKKHAVSQLKFASLFEDVGLARFWWMYPNSRQFLAWFSPFNGFVKGSIHRIHRDCGLVLRISAIQPLAFLKWCLKMLMLRSFPPVALCNIRIISSSHWRLQLPALRPPYELLAYRRPLGEFFSFIPSS